MMLLMGRPQRPLTGRPLAMQRAIDWAVFVPVRYALLVCMFVFFVCIYWPACFVHRLYGVFFRGQFLRD